MPSTASPIQGVPPCAPKTPILRGTLLLAGIGAALALASCQPVGRPHNHRACTMDYRPVCGFKLGKRETFMNRCVADSEAATRVSDGACR